MELSADADRLNEIMDNLRWHERREVKSWAETWTFQCDILGNLPLEMVALTVQYLDLKDIFVLRRVRYPMIGHCDIY